MESSHNMAYALVTPHDTFKSDEDLAGLVETLSAAIMKAITFLKDNMHWIVAGVLFNPVLFLHIVNALLTATKNNLRMPYMISSYIEPHIDINNNPAHATIFILFMICAQWQAFQRCFFVANQQAINKGDGRIESIEEYCTDDE